MANSLVCILLLTYSVCCFALSDYRYSDEYSGRQDGSIELEERKNPCPRNYVFNSILNYCESKYKSRYNRHFRRYDDKSIDRSDTKDMDTLEEIIDRLPYKRGRNKNDYIPRYSKEFRNDETTNDVVQDIKTLLRTKLNTMPSFYNANDLVGMASYQQPLPSMLHPYMPSGFMSMPEVKPVMQTNQFLPSNIMMPPAPSSSLMYSGMFMPQETVLAQPPIASNQKHPQSIYIIVTQPPLPVSTPPLPTLPSQKSSRKINSSNPETTTATKTTKIAARHFNIEELNNDRNGTNKKSKHKSHHKIKAKKNFKRHHKSNTSKKSHKHYHNTTGTPTTKTYTTQIVANGKKQTKNKKYRNQYDRMNYDSNYSDGSIEIMESYHPNSDESMNLKDRYNGTRNDRISKLPIIPHLSAEDSQSQKLNPKNDNVVDRTEENINMNDIIAEESYTKNTNDNYSEKEALHAQDTHKNNNYVQFLDLLDHHYRDAIKNNSNSNDSIFINDEKEIDKEQLNAQNSNIDDRHDINANVDVIYKNDSKATGTYEDYITKSEDSNTNSPKAKDIYLIYNKLNDLILKYRNLEALKSNTNRNAEESNTHDRVNVTDSDFTVPFLNKFDRKSVYSNNSNKVYIQSKNVESNKYEPVIYVVYNDSSNITTVKNTRKLTVTLSAVNFQLTSPSTIISSQITTDKQNKIKIVDLIQTPKNNDKKQKLPSKISEKSLSTQDRRTSSNKSGDIYDENEQVEYNSTADTKQTKTNAIEPQMEESQTEAIQKRLCVEEEWSDNKKNIYVKKKCINETRPTLEQEKLSTMQDTFTVIQATPKYDSKNITKPEVKFESISYFDKMTTEQPYVNEPTVNPLIVKFKHNHYKQTQLPQSSRSTYDSYFQSNNLVNPVRVLLENNKIIKQSVNPSDDMTINESRNHLKLNNALYYNNNTVFPAIEEINTENSNVEETTTIYGSNDDRFKISTQSLPIGETKFNDLRFFSEDRDTKKEWNKLNNLSPLPNEYEITETPSKYQPVLSAIPYNSNIAQYRPRNIELIKHSYRRITN